MKIVNINKYKWRSNKMKVKDEIIELENGLKQNNIDHIYSLQEVEKISKDILTIFGFSSKKTSIPIVKIVKEFDFNIYKESLPDKLSGDIYINGNTIDEYGHDKVILVNKNEHLFHQRFVAAHELAHYLFDFLGNPLYNDKNIKFSDTYYKDQHETPEEKIANWFAASIMMPKDIFIEQYNFAKKEYSKTTFVMLYLSRYFETPIDSIEKRFSEV
ncbi:MAG: ImmA/IrrE family metallo-endopeptidase [Lachnospiraceae bacterium]|nr:ImmA/IrrE family metallo-endopeptidase [Lachnospiraceae bacterium]